MSIIANADGTDVEIDQAQFMRLVDTVKKGVFSSRLVRAAEPLPHPILKPVARRASLGRRLPHQPTPPPPEQAVISEIMLGERLDQLRINAIILIWKAMINDLQFTLETWDSCLTLHLDFYRLIGRDWQACFVWDCSGMVGNGPREAVRALGDKGRVRHLTITRFDAFKHDWALAVLFDGCDVA